MMFIGRKVGYCDESALDAMNEHMRCLAAIIVMEGDMLVHNIPPEYHYVYEACGYEFTEVYGQVVTPTNPGLADQIKLGIEQ